MGGALYDPANRAAAPELTPLGVAKPAFFAAALPAFFGLAFTNLPDRATRHRRPELQLRKPKARLPAPLRNPQHARRPTAEPKALLDADKQRQRGAALRKEGNRTGAW